MPGQISITQESPPEPVLAATILPPSWVLVVLLAFLVTAVVFRRLAWRELCGFPWARELLRDPDELDENDIPDEIPEEIYTPVVLFAGLTKFIILIGFGLIAIYSARPGALALPSLLVAGLYAVAAMVADWERALGWEHHDVPSDQTRRWFRYRAISATAFAAWLGGCLFLMFTLVA